MKSRLRLLIAGLLCSASLMPAQAADQTAKDEWEFLVAPYVWASGLDGDLALAGVPASVDLSFGDVFNVLDGGGLLHFEAARNRWTLLADAIYLDLGQDFDLVPGEADVEQAILEGGAGYALADSVDILFGARYTSVDTELRFTGPLSLTIGGDQDWIDPFIGARWTAELSKRWEASVRGDVGGFGAASDLVWQLRAAAILRASELIKVSFGYRLMDYDYEDGAGLSRFEYDVQLSGAEIGVGFIF